MLQVEVPLSPLATEMDADLLGRSSGRMFAQGNVSAVNQGNVCAVDPVIDAPTKQKSPQEAKKLRRNRSAR